MKKFIFLFAIVLSQVFTPLYSQDQKAETLKSEWNRFRNEVETINPDGDIGGYMLYRDYQDMTLLWRTSFDPNENEVIRFFMKRDDGTVFAVTYHKSDIIIPGRQVLRRFVGTEPTGWINHTIDFETNEYLGTQGQRPQLTSSEKSMMKKWGIKNF